MAIAIFYLDTIVLIVFCFCFEQTELVIMNQSSDKDFASKQETEINKRKQSSSAQG